MRHRLRKGEVSNCKWDLRNGEPTLAKENPASDPPRRLLQRAPARAQYATFSRLGKTSSIPCRGARAGALLDENSSGKSAIEGSEEMERLDRDLEIRRSSSEIDNQAARESGQHSTVLAVAIPQTQIHLYL